MTIDQFTKSSSPITVIVNIANPVAVKLAKILIEQGSRLLIIDRLTSAKKQLIGDLLGRNDCLFMEAESTFKNIEKFKKIDYVYYFLSQIAVGSTFPEVFAESMEIVQLPHKDFLKESNRVDAYVKLATSFDASFTLITSAYISQFLELLPESNVQLQKYAESLVLDYVQKTRLNGRIVRLGELIGKDADLTSPTNVARLTREVLLREKINVFGDGLQQNYLVHSEDAVYAVLKAAFTKEAKGRTYLASYPHPFTSLSVVYQLLELTTDEKEVVFNEVLPKHSEIARLKDLCLAPSISALGWEPQVPLEQALAETMISLAADLKQPWQTIEKTAPPTIESEQGTSIESGVIDTKKKKGKNKSSGKVSVTGGSGLFFKQFYQKMVLQPIANLFDLPTILKNRFSDSSANIQYYGIRTAIVVSLIALLGIFLLPYIHFGITGVKLFNVVKNLKQEAAAFNSDNFDTYSKKLTEYVEGMSEDYEAVSYLGKVPQVSTMYAEGSNLMKAMSTYSSSVSVSLKAGAPALGMVKGFASISPNNPSGTVSRDYFKEIDDIMQQKSNFTQAVQNAQIAKLQLQMVNIEVFPAFVQPQLEKVRELAYGYTTTSQEVLRVYDLIPYLMGYKDRRTYYLMMQNETELRATGGWFTNYAIVGIENGQVRQFTVNDVYDIDGKINGITPPADMQKGLGINEVKVATSNWDPSMKVTAETITKLMEEAGVYKPNDVTVSLTFQVVRDMLEITGPVTVESLGEVSAQNLYEKVGVLHANFVPGSTEKSKAVSDFMPKLLEGIVQLPLEKKQLVVDVLLQSVRQKNIMIYSGNQQLQTGLLDFYKTYRTLLPVNTPLMAVDWNWGGNKANMFTKRSAEVEIDEQLGVAKFALTYTNESKSDQYPQGKYVNVQRIFYPQEFTYVRSDGYAKAPVGYKSADLLPYTLAELIVEKQETKTVTQHFLINKMPKEISLYKQSGIDVEVVKVLISRAANSAIDQSVLQEQGFSEMSGKWVKTFIRKEDVVIQLARR